MKKESTRSTKLFWTLHIGGWIAFYLLYFTMVSMMDSKPWDMKNWLLFTLTYVLGFLITIGLRYIYRYYHHRIEKLMWLPIIIVAISILTTIVWNLIDLTISHFFWGEMGGEILKQRLTPKSFLKFNYVFMIVLTAWSSLYFGIKYAMDWQNEKLRAQEAVAMAQKAQMEMLRYQLNPHFLFNSLNSIRALVDENQGHAKSMITELSEFLRYSLLHKDATFVSLTDELEAVKHYFSIEKKRFEEKLEVSYNIADDTKNAQILTFLLHPIIENAVKYGMKTSPMPLKISLSTQKTGIGLMIEVCNSGHWVEHEANDKQYSGTGTGIKNVEKRLQNAYGDNYRLETLKGEDNICVRIEIKEAYLHG